ncbi:cyclohexanone monooxygenase [Mollisia scopiformis]|uniref:Cyclohexanone monooxygenase n=1 Tax=Mollisia scopiformis TaxID=149040 RepID=A0A194X8F2_MOLSC|nr:cyclohexanone monooxygenase [Mollisia scopiformis]KUJ16448.1 cyclohexanone monooxygenase [Mollisia scopiformis]
MGDPGPEQPECIIKTDLSQYARRRATDGPYADNLDLDVLIVGAGFSGVYMLYEMRKYGYKTVLYDAGLGYGGTWRWNCYPGARVDSPVPIYQLNIPEVYNTFSFTTNYPDWRELQSYFDHVDKVCNLSKDTAFETVVTSAEYDEKAAKWTVKTADGRTVKTRFFIVAAGFAAKRYIPQYKSMDKFKGVVHHSSFWPPEDVDVKGKRVAVVGTGASGVQIAQEWGPIADHLTLFQRTPNLALPMGKRPMSKEEQDALRPAYSQMMDLRERCFAGFLYDFNEKNTFDDNEEEREALFEKLWKQQGFALWLGGYKDYLFDMKANREAYNFWAKKQRQRIKNPAKRDLLCPLEPPHAFGIKRPCLEQNYYEVLDRDNVDIVDISLNGGNEIVEFTENGMKTSDGKVHEVDVVALATGFDITTGGMTSMGLKSIHGTYLKDEWKASANTYLGTTISGYPNLFHLYGPHGPTLLSNGPSSLEIQARWIRDAIVLIDRQGLKSIEATPEAMKEWKQRINDISNATLMPTTKSTYMGGTVPGKAFEQVNYAGGVGQYREEIRKVLDDWKGFKTIPITA